MDQATRQKIEKRAYELFLERGGVHGYHMEDWLRAEKEIVGKNAAPATPSQSVSTTTAKPQPQQAQRGRKSASAR